MEKRFPIGRLAERWHRHGFTDRDVPSQSIDITHFLEDNQDSTAEDGRRLDHSNTGLTVPLQIQCSSCGHQGTVPDSYVGKEIKCPKCQRLLVPLTPEKMENYAAKVLFAAPAHDAPPHEIIPEEAAGPEILFACPFCGEAYQVSEDLAGKKITCRNCREPCKVDSPKSKKKPRRRRFNLSWPMVWLGILLSLFFVLIGFLMGRISRS